MFLFSKYVVVGHTKKSQLSYVNKNVKHAVIPKGVELILSSAFKDCKKLESVIFPESMIRINKDAFSRFTRMGTSKEIGDSFNSVKLNEGLEVIGDSAFFGCEELKEIKIPNSVNYIGSLAFSCSGIKEITIPVSVTHIGKSAFSCRTVNYRGTEAEWNAINSDVKPVVEVSGSRPTSKIREYVAMHHPRLDQLPKKPVIYYYKDQEELIKSIDLEPYVDKVVEKVSRILGEFIEKEIEKESIEKPFAIYGPVDREAVTKRVIEFYENSPVREDLTIEVKIDKFELPSYCKINFNYKGE